MLLAETGIWPLLLPRLPRGVQETWTHRSRRNWYSADNYVRRAKCIMASTDDKLYYRVFLGFSTYFIVGVVILRFHYGFQGRNAIPNLEFWAELPFYVRVRILDWVADKKRAKFDRKKALNMPLLPILVLSAGYGVWGCFFFLEEAVNFDTRMSIFRLWVHFWLWAASSP